MLWLLIGTSACHKPPRPQVNAPELVFVPGVHNRALMRLLERELRVDVAEATALALDDHDERTRGRLVELLVARDQREACGDCYEASILVFTDRSWAPESLNQLGLDALSTIEAELGPGTLTSLRHAPLPPIAETLEQAQLIIEHTGLAPCRVDEMPSGPWRPSGGYHRGTVSLHPPIPHHALRPLLFHECAPGHHQQRTAQAEHRGWPLFLHRNGSSAISEGWAHYAESLADEMGLYDTAEQRQGYLAARAWRAARLVVDTGLHNRGWSKEQAAAFLRDHTALPDAQIQHEVARHLEHPGEMLSYKIGELEIRSLRTMAEAQLGESFDLDGFHSLVHRPGQSLPGLERDVLAWIEDHQ